MLEKRLEQLEAKMRAMELELAELRQVRPGDERLAEPKAGSGAMQHSADPRYEEMPRGDAAYEQPGMPRQPGMHQQSPPPVYGQSYGFPGFPPPGNPAPSPDQGQAPYGYQQGQGTGPAQGAGRSDKVAYPSYAYNPQQPSLFPKEPKAPKDWEYLIARVWLPRIFIVVLLLGVLWGFTAAVSAGYLTEPVRCLLGVVASAAMYWLGERQIRSRREALGQVLLGGSIGVLILTVFAAHELYELIPSWLAFALYILSIALGVFTALRRRSQTLIIIATVAGYLIPFLVHSSHPNAWVFAGYEALFSLAMITVALKFDFRAAYFVAVGVLHLPLLFGYAAGDFEESRHIFIGAIFIQHAALLAYAMFGPARRKLDEALTLFPGYGLMVLWMYALYPYTENGIQWRPLLLILWALLYSLAALGKAMQGQRSQVFISIATAAWFVWSLDILDPSYSPAMAVVIGTAGYILGLKLRNMMQQITSGVVFAYGALGTLTMAIHQVVSPQTLSWMILLLGIWLLSYVIRLSKGETADILPDILMWVDAMLAIVFITQITNVLTAGQSYDFRHLILSAVWALYAMLVIGCGIVIQRKMVRIAGISLLFLTLIKVIIVDLPGVSPAVRAILFIGLGALGMVVSRFLYKRRSQEAPASPADEASIEPKA